MSEESGQTGVDSEDELPGIDFSTFILSLSHSALVHLGDVPDPSGSVPDADTNLAKQTIDLLGLLREKTAGNLSGKEERLLEQVLVDLRSRYQEVVSAT